MSVASPQRKPALTATQTDYVGLVEAMPAGAIVILSDVSWEEYDRLLHDLDEHTGIRLTYDRGKLQIMTVSLNHEKPAGFFPHLIMLLAMECGMNFISARSTTLRKQVEEKGTEPDDCYYFKNYKLIGAKKQIDLTVDPPPDLAFEVDITNPSLTEFPIYAAIGVPELWRYTNQGVHFYRLEEDDYVEINRSDLFPFLSPNDLFTFLSIGESEGAVGMAVEFKDWIKANKEKQQ